MTIKMWQQGCDDAKAGKSKTSSEYSYGNGYAFGVQQCKKADEASGLVERWLQELEGHARLLRTSDPVGANLYARRADVLRNLTRQA